MGITTASLVLQLCTLRGVNVNYNPGWTPKLYPDVKAVVLMQTPVVLKNNDERTVAISWKAKVQDRPLGLGRCRCKRQCKRKGKKVK